MTFPCFVKALDAAANVPSDAEHYRERARLCCLSHREFNRPCMGRDIGGGNIRRTNCPPAGSGRLVPRRNLDTTTAQHVDVGSSKDALLAANLVADVSEVRIGRNQTLDLIAVTASR